MEKKMVPFEDIEAVPADHHAWKDDPNQKAEDGVKLVLASTLIRHAMRDEDLDVDVKDHTTRPFVKWVKRR